MTIAVDHTYHTRAPAERGALFLAVSFPGAQTGEQTRARCGRLLGGPTMDEEGYMRCVWRRNLSHSESRRVRRVRASRPRGPPSIRCHPGPPATKNKNLTATRTSPSTSDAILLAAPAYACFWPSCVSMAAASSSFTSTEQDALKALTFQRLHPKTYLERFLAEDVRPDGRNLDEWRDVSVIVGPCIIAQEDVLGSLTIVRVQTRFRRQMALRLSG